MSDEPRSRRVLWERASLGTWIRLTRVDDAGTARLSVSGPVGHVLVRELRVQLAMVLLRDVHEVGAHRAYRVLQQHYRNVPVFEFDPKENEHAAEREAP